MEDIRQTPESLAEKGLHEAFQIGVILKGIGAILEIILGLLLIFGTNILDLVYSLINDELLDDPNDFFASHFHALVAPTPQALLFGGLYLLSHGVVKGFLIAGLIRNKLWAYPASLAVFSLFILYQLVRWTHTHSLWLLSLTFLDMIMMWLIWHEYRHMKKAATPTA